MYEILTGLPPHYNSDKFKMYKSISKNPVNIPENRFGPELKDLLEKLLEIDPDKRICQKHGISEIK